ncbi:MAG TPA: PQQ-dependent sugar dehydrogenase [Vicinamibacterales bacterium]|nr:PQQ-dependent sugar dehydrogenase [Vicinamibacterales bacterium]
MWHALSAGALALVLATQAVETRACPDDNPSSTPPPATTDVLTTRDGVRFRVETVLTGFEVPWAMAFAPDGRLFITERPGRVRIVTLGNATPELALTVDGVYTQSEAGLLGLALDPDFSQNHFVYLYHSAAVPSGGVNRIVRYREVNARLTERVVLLDNIPASPVHDGGRLKFGPDGLLYASAGDASNPSLAQDVASLSGKILRLNRDGTTPRDNRFSSPVFTYGHRNPQGFDWHPATGDMWASEHGNSGNDEINAIQSGANFGWPRIEGGATMPGMETPATFFNPAIAPSGASFYRGQRFPQFANNLFVATLRGTHLLRLTVDPSTRRVVSQERLLDGTFGRIRDVITGPDGYLYLCTNNRDGRGSPASSDDRILRLVPAS